MNVVRARRAPTAIAVALLAAVPAASAGAPHGEAARVPTTITCATRTWQFVNPRVRPRHRCVIFRANTPDHAHEFDLRRMHWRHWGARNARASAQSVYVGMGSVIRHRVALHAYRRRRACGRNAYTRLTVRFKRDGRTYTLRPPACHRRLY